MRHGLAVLLTPKPPPCISAVLGENALKVKESDFASEKSGKEQRRAGPGIVISEAQDNESDVEPDGSPQPSPGVMPRTDPGSPATPGPRSSAQPSPVASPLPT